MVHGQTQIERNVADSTGIPSHKNPLNQRSSTFHIFLKSGSLSQGKSKNE